MTAPLPPGIAAYFAAVDNDDDDALVACFGDEAVVVDEDREWRGRPSIRHWRETVATRFDYTLEVLGARDVDGRVDVHTHLEGNFPGGTVDLEYRFTLTDGRISRLEIVPTAAA
jgi:ketosteroid isomerase-like protein